MLVKDLFISSLTIILYIIFSILSIEFSKFLELFMVPNERFELPTFSFFTTSFSHCGLDFSSSYLLTQKFRVKSLHSKINLLARSCHKENIFFFLFVHFLYWLLYMSQLNYDNQGIKELNCLLDYLSNYHQYVQLLMGQNLYMDLFHPIHIQRIYCYIYLLSTYEYDERFDIDLLIHFLLHFFIFEFIVYVDIQFDIYCCSIYFLMVSLFHNLNNS